MKNKIFENFSFKNEMRSMSTSLIPVEAVFFIVIFLAIYYWYINTCVIGDSNINKHIKRFNRIYKLI